MENFLKAHGMQMFIGVFSVVIVSTCAIVLWETFTNNSIVDIIFDEWEAKRKMKFNKIISDKDDLTIILRTMGRCLSDTEKRATLMAADYIDENDNIEFARRILNMIENNGASNEDIKQFCETYIRSKEEKKNE